MMCWLLATTARKGLMLAGKGRLATAAAHAACGGCLLALHAEHQAISQALRNNLALSQAVLYSTLSPCLPCACIIFGAKQGLYCLELADQVVVVDGGLSARSP